MDMCIFPKYSKNVSRVHFVFQDEFDDSKGVIKIRKSMKDRQHNGQKKKKVKQRSTKHYTQK